MMIHFFDHINQLSEEELKSLKQVNVATYNLPFPIFICKFRNLDIYVYTEDEKLQEKLIKLRRGAL